MTQIGNVLEINALKEHLNELKKKELITEWEIPYENILTRISAVILFLSPNPKSNLVEIWEELGVYDISLYRLNDDDKFSKLEWRVEFKARKPLVMVSKT